MMIRRALVAGALGAAVLLCTPVAAMATTPSDVDGLWSSVDVDGSHQLMVVVQNGPGFEAVLLDDYASMCGGGPALAVGPGTLSGDTLSVHFTVFCTNHHALAPVTDNFAFDAATTTLTDSGAAVWHRF